MDKEIVMYIRTAYCPGVALARDLLTRYKVAFREVNIDDDSDLAAQLKAWAHHYSVPTLIIANLGEDVPYTDYLPRPTERSIKGYDRGPMISEPNNRDLENWLYKHGFLDKPYRR
jgi:glutaredoxin